MARKHSKGSIRTNLKPLGFLSYASSDDEHHKGWVGAFRRSLSGEVQAQTGDPFPIFQDRKDIKWGENWRERIKKALEAATFLFPIVTPSFLKSKECQKEFQQFLIHEKRLKRGDLIFPVYFIKCPALEKDKAGKGRAKSDNLVREIKKRQICRQEFMHFLDREKKLNRKDTIIPILYLGEISRFPQDELGKEITQREMFDWRDLRFEPFDSPRLRKKVSELSRRVWEVVSGS